jgi:hypothetical protein
MSINHTIDESENIYEKINEENVSVGDTIEIMSNNQQGYKKYKVIIKEEKDIELIDSYDHWIQAENDLYNGGKVNKPKTSKCKTSKRKTSNRKTSNRKTNKRKINKRKTNKRKTSKRKTSNRKN